MTSQSNDNEAFTPVAKFEGPDPFGQAALLLVESLLHGLIASSTITLENAVDIVTVAIDVKDEIAADLGNSPETKDKSLELLAAIKVSLRNDLI